MDATFGVDLAAGAMVKRDTTMIELNVSKGNIFDMLSLQEDIRVGQRVEQWIFEMEDHGGWKQVAAGTTIGYKRLLRFPLVKARRVRLRVLESRLNPVIERIGLI